MSALPFDREFEFMKVRALSVGEALNERYRARLPEGERDYLFACYIFGLTEPLFKSSERQLRLEACMGLLLTQLSAERSAKALSFMPDNSPDWADRAYQAAEQLGIRDANQFLDRTRGAKNNNDETIKIARESDGAAGIGEGT
jgi:hypothetical protein